MDQQISEDSAERPSWGRLFYNHSTQRSLPPWAVILEAVKPGTRIRLSTLRSCARDAGFAGVDVLSIASPQLRFCRLTP